MIKNLNDIALKEKLNNSLFRNGLMKAMLAGIVDDNLKSKFEVELNYIIDNKRELFNNNLIIGNFYDDDDKIEDLILPTIKKTWSMIFITPPTLFTIKLNDKRFELFKLLWDVDEFINYLLDILNFLLLIHQTQASNEDFLLLFWQLNSSIICLFFYYFLVFLVLCLRLRFLDFLFPFRAVYSCKSS